MKKLTLWGIPVIGVIIPFIGKVRIYLNRDGSQVDTGQIDAHDEYGPLYVEPIVFEWLGFGFPLTPAVIKDSKTGEDSEFTTKEPIREEDYIK